MFLRMLWFQWQYEIVGPCGTIKITRTGSWRAWEFESLILKPHLYTVTLTTLHHELARDQLRSSGYVYVFANSVILHY